MSDFSCANCGSSTAASTAQRAVDRNVRGPVSTDLCARCTGVRFWNGVRGMAALGGLAMVIVSILEKQYLGTAAVAVGVAGLWWFSGIRLAAWKTN